MSLVSASRSLYFIRSLCTAYPRAISFALFPVALISRLGSCLLLDARSLLALFRATFTAAKTESPDRRAAATVASYPPCPNIAAVYRNFTLRECTSRPLRPRFVDNEACPEPSRSTRDFIMPLRRYTIFENIQHFHCVRLRSEVERIDYPYCTFPML